MYFKHLSIFILLFSVNLLACSGGESSGVNNGWVEIHSPTEDDQYELEKFWSSTLLAGKAFATDRTVTIDSCYCTARDLITCSIAGFVPGVYVCNTFEVPLKAKIEILNTTMDGEGKGYAAIGTIDDHGESWSGQVPLQYGKNEILVTASDGGNNYATDSLTIINTNDVTPPPDAEIIIRDITNSSIQFQWYPVYDNYLTSKYYIYRDNEIIKELLAPVYDYAGLYDPIYSFDDNPLLDVIHCYYLIAEDPLGNRSEPQKMLPCAAVSEKYNTTVKTGELRYPLPSFLLDDNDDAHIVYAVETDNGDISIMYSTNASGKWVTSAVEENLASPQTLADTNLEIDLLNGFPQILYCNGSTAYLATYNAGTWNSKVVSSCDEPSFASGSDGVTHIVSAKNYNATNNFFSYITTDNQGATTTQYWVNDLGLCSKYSSVAVDSNNEAHMVFSDNSEILYRKASSAYNSVIQFPLDYNPHIAGPADCTYSPKVSIAIDEDDVPHVAYTSYDGNYYHIYYAKYTGGSWVKSKIYSNPVSINVRMQPIVLDSNGTPYIHYYEYAPLRKKNILVQKDDVWKLYDNSSMSVFTILDIHSDGTAHFFGPLDDSLEYRIYLLK